MKLLHTLLLLLCAAGIAAQTPATYTVKGILIAKSGRQPVEGASVVVLNASGKTIGAVYSNDKGMFLLGEMMLPSGVTIEISNVGFKTITLSPEVKNAADGKVIDMGRIMMEEVVNTLDNVVISGKRKAFEMKLDRRVFSPDAQLTARGGTAIDVLKNVPSLSVDAQGGVELRGSSPQIFVDGRPTILTLEQIAADDIEKIEVITNPSSKYDAGTSGGILNIVLKKNKARGLNGNASAGAGYPDILTGYIGMNIRQKKLNFFVTGNYNQSGGIARGEANRTNLKNGLEAGGFTQVSYNDRLRKNTSARAGVDYFFNDKNTFTLSYGRSGGNGSSEGEQDQRFFDENGVSNGTGFRNENYRWNWNNHSTQFLYKKTFTKPGKELTADLTYNRNSGTNGSFFTNSFFTPGNQAPSETFRVRNDGGSNSDQVTAQIDYVNPIGEEGKFEAGLRHFANDYRSIFNAYSVAAAGESKLPFSNHIQYRETISAAYANYGNTFKKLKLSVQAGLRVEYSRFKGELVDSNRNFGYTWPGNASDLLQSLFPSLYLTRTLKEGTQLQLNYARRIRRPNFWQLNPFVDISDPLNLRQGNLNLRPETVHSFELNLNREYEKGTFMVSAFFRNNLDDITRYSDTITTAQLQQLNNAAVNANAILNTFINADFTNRMGLELNLQHKFSERFDIMPSANLQYRHVRASAGNLNLNNTGFNWETQLTANYRVASKKKWLDKLAWQLTGEYESPEVIPQGRTIAEWRVDMALRKEFMANNRASLVFAVDDVFNSRRWGSDIATPTFRQDSYSRWNVRSFRLTLSLRFGSSDFQLLNKRKGGGEDGEGGEG